jgi:hypothetical protein
MAFTRLWRAGEALAEADDDTMTGKCLANAIGRSELEKGQEKKQTEKGVFSDREEIVCPLYDGFLLLYFRLIGPVSRAQRCHHHGVRPGTRETFSWALETRVKASFVTFTWPFFFRLT